MSKLINYLPIQISMVILVFGLFSCRGANDDNVLNGQFDNVLNGRFEVTIENTGQMYPILKSGAFTTPEGASEPSPIGPGDTYEFEFTAPVGANLSLATMFAQSNDWFFGTEEEGIALYNEDGSKVTGDVTAQIDLYDAGTEEDQEVGVGDNQAPRQSGSDTGPADVNPNVRLVDNEELPADEDMIRVTLSSTGSYGFRVRIENSSNNNTLQTSEGSKPVLLSPGVWLVHPADENKLLFTVGETDYGDGLERIAEDGDPEMLAAGLADMTGITGLLSPGAYAIFSGENPIFVPGQPTPSNGIEAVAEDGNPSMLGSFLSSADDVKESGIFNTPIGADGPGILLPGDRYTVTFMAEEGDMLTFATMYVQSNDLFYSPAASGIPLFSNEMPVSGDVTDQIVLWDGGTEASAEPGIGSNQAPRQSGPDTGMEDPDSNVRQVDDGYDYGEVSSHIKVTIRMINN